MTGKESENDPTAAKEPVGATVAETDVESNAVCVQLEALLLSLLDFVASKLVKMIINYSFAANYVSTTIQ